MEFLVAFPRSAGSPSASFRLYVAPVRDEPVTVTLSVPLEGRSTTVALVGGSARRLDFGTTGSGVLVRASGAVVVYGVSAQAGTCSGYAALPVAALGRDYYVLAVAGSSAAGRRSTLTIVATRYNTVVSVAIAPGRGVTVTHAGQRYHAGRLLLVRLDAYATLQLTAAGDLTGTRVESTRPVAVFAGSTRSGDDKAPAADDSWEQMVPTSSLGALHTVVPPTTTSTDARPSRLKIVATRARTRVTVSGRPWEVIAEAGGMLEVDVPPGQYVSVVSNETVLVGQYVRSSAGAVSLAVVPPARQHRGEYVFVAPWRPDRQYALQLVVVIDEAYVAGLALDGVAVPNTLWHTMSGSTLVYRRFSPAAGFHRLTHASAGARFTATMHMQVAGECQLSYPVGMCLDGVALVSRK